VGEFTHTLVGMIVNVPKQPFINVARVLGGILLVYIAVRQWLAARDGGADAVHRAGIVLLATAVLSPAMLPWYVSWGMALLAAAAWSVRGMQLVVFLSVMLTISYYSHGEDALYNFPYLFWWALVAVLATVSLVRPDPLRLSAGAWQRTRRPSPDAPVPAASPASVVVDSAEPGTS
jgi:alpha-1,6-mannosyltransferase